MYLSKRKYNNYDFLNPPDDYYDLTEIFLDSITDKIYYKHNHYYYKLNNRKIYIYFNDDLFLTELNKYFIKKNESIYIAKNGLRDYE